MFIQLDSAIAFAALAHAGQMRKYSVLPYVVHPIEVMTILVEKSSLPVSEDMMVAAVLHDVVEDTSVSIDTIVRRFGQGVGLLVHELTDQFTAGSGGNRAERKAKEAERLGKISGQAQTIKYADLIANTSSIVEHDPGFARKYLEEKERVLHLMAAGDPELRLLAYTSLANGQTALMRRAL